MALDDSAWKSAVLYTRTTNGYNPDAEFAHDDMVTDA
jgi:hypothetical protein